MTTLCLWLAGVGGAIVQSLAQEQPWESIPIPVQVSEKNSFIWPNLLRFLQQDFGVSVAQFELAQRHIQETPDQLYGLEAVKQGKVFITDGNAYFNRPGPRLVDSLEILAEILHPDALILAIRERLGNL